MFHQIRRGSRLERHQNANGCALGTPAVHVELTTHAEDTLAHAHDSVRALAALRYRRQPRAVIADLELHPRAIALQLDPGMRRLGMPHDIGKRLLHDAEQRNGDVSRQGLSSSGTSTLH